MTIAGAPALTAVGAAWLRRRMADTRVRHRARTREHGEDLLEVRDWPWPHE